MPNLRALLTGLAAAIAAASGLKAEPAVLGLARAYLGPESTLESLTSIHYVGSLVRSDEGRPGLPVPTGLEMVFAKPLRQKLIVRGPKVTMTTVLDGYDAWDWLQDNSDPTKYKLTWLGAPDIKTLRANTWENLYYYFAPEGGSVEDKGPATEDGVQCERIDFSHGSGIVYQRYFDRDTGRLVLTINGNEEIRESGEIRAGGIRFPKVIVSSTRLASGKALSATATFDRITINEPLAADTFAVPTAPMPLARPASAGK
jgi:hypothetical protein